LCTFPGTTAQIPPFVYKGEPNVDTFINNFITAADIHLRTVSGIYNAIAMLGVPPTAAATKSTRTPQIRIFYPSILNS
jgi:hypothetical protein